jgi:signal transduction histidine kinase/CheY-like chemotaxis protein
MIDMCATAASNADKSPVQGQRGAGVDFLSGGGEMGARMRALDWTRTPLGAPPGWPQSLKTIVRVMLDSRYAMWMLWGPELTFFCNDAYLPTVGIKRDWVLGARSDKVWEEIWPDIGPRIQHVLEHGQATWDEGLLLFLERSGFAEETYHTFSYSPVYDDQSRIAGMLCVVTEVTERVIGERRLRVLRDLATRASGVETVKEACKRLIGVLGDAEMDVPFACLYVLDEAGKHAWLAASVGAIPEPWRPAQLPLEGESGPWPVAHALARGEAQVVRLPNGAQGIASPFWEETVSRALVLPVQRQGSLTPTAALVAGISPRRALDDGYRGFLDLIAAQLAAAIGDAQAFEAERRRAEALAEIDRAKTTFFSNVSHEFRTPLTLMLGPIEAAAAHAGTPPSVREQLLLAQRNALRLLKLVNSLLDFSRIEAGRVQASFEPVDVAALTEDLASNFRSAIEAAGLAFEVDCEPLDEPVYLDREMWEKIVLNLLSNAFKFTFAGRIAVRLRREESCVRLEVADTGVGIPREEIPRLFERFHRVEGTRGRTQEGSGIGLALVQELVKLHGGRIDVTSDLRRGTSFRILVPMGTAHLPPERIKAPRVLASTATGTQAYLQEALSWLPDARGHRLLALNEAPVGGPQGTFAATAGARILLADDNADMRAYLFELLSGSYAVEAVADGEQALAAVRRDPPDLILSDVMMPRLDGFALLKALREDESLRSIPVILLSARAGEESRIEGLAAGADDYLAKPFSARELTARVTAHLELARVRREATAALHQRTLQYEALLNGAPLGVFLVDADFCIRQVNPIALPVLGDVPGLIGHDFEGVARRLWSPAFAEELVRLFRHTLDTGEPFHMPELIERRRDRGVTECYEWQIMRIPLPDARYGVVCYFRDISAHVLARTRLETADRQKNEFLAMLAHELRNPLAPIRNAGELLSRSLPADARMQSITHMLQRQVSVLVRLVDDLLDVSRITQGRIVLKRRPVQLAEIVAQAMETVEPLIQEKRHRISVVSYRPLRVDGDATRLVQCVVNVLTNAAKYTQPEGEIRVESSERDGGAVLTITDNGPGIPEDLLPHVFDLFVQSERTLDRSQGGLGIGLSLVKRLVEMHGGRVSASSPGSGRGSIFEIRLPLSKQDLEQVGEDPVEMPPARILIVDDNADAANSLGSLLELEGHRIEVTYGSSDVLARARTFRPDIVLLDIGLPEMDGYEVARRIRALPEFRGVRLVALTGYGQAEDRQRAKSSGFDDHLVKPVEFPTLRRVLAGLPRAAKE